MSATLDVSQLINDPDFTQPATLHRQTLTVNTYGEATTTETSLTISVVAMGVTGKELERIDAGARLDEYIKVYSTTLLNAGSKTGTLPDRLTLNGTRYITKSIEEAWRGYGVPWNCAILRLESVTAYE